MGIVVLLAIIFWQIFLRDLKVLGQAKLNWNASSESDVNGYKIYRDGGYTKKVDVGKKTSYQIDNLKDGSTYYFSVTSYNASGKESCFSEEMQKTVKLSIFDKFKSFFKKEKN